MNALAVRPREAARMLGISLRYLQELTHNGEIPHIKLGRATLYAVDDLREWLRSRRVATASTSCVAPASTSCVAPAPANGIPPGPTSEIECDA